MTRGSGAGALLVALVAAACSGSTVTENELVATTPASSPTASATSAATTATESQTTAAVTLSASTLPAVAALTSGRGDDGSLEVGIWFTSDPFAAGDARVLLGADSDNSFPGTGSPVGHLDGWAEISPVGIVLFDDGDVVADDVRGDLGEWLSWTGPGPAGFVYFFGNVPTRAGTIWVVLEIDGVVVPGGAAGAPFGTGCSYRSAGIGIEPVRGEVPDPGAPCRYPLG